MASKKEISVTLDADQLNHADGYLKSFDNCKTVQDVIRMLLSETPDSMVSRLAQQKEKLRVSDMESRNEIVSLKAEETRLTSALEASQTAIANYKEACEGYRDEIRSMKLDTEQVRKLNTSLCKRHQEIVGYLNSLDDVLPLSSFSKDISAFENSVELQCIQDLVKQKRQLRKEIDDIAAYFKCEQNASAILYEVQEQLKTIASKLGVPDTLEHIVDRIVELNHIDLGRQPEINKNVNDALKMVGVALDMPRDGEPIDIKRILQRIEENRKDTKKKSQLADELDALVANLEHILSLDKPLTLDEIVAEVQRMLLLKGEREREVEWFRKQSRRPLWRIIWERLTHKRKENDDGIKK